MHPAGGLPRRGKSPAWKIRARPPLSAPTTLNSGKSRSSFLEEMGSAQAFDAERQYRRVTFWDEHISAAYSPEAPDPAKHRAERCHCRSPINVTSFSPGASHRNIPRGCRCGVQSVVDDLTLRRVRSAPHLHPTGKSARTGNLKVKNPERQDGTIVPPKKARYGASNNVEQTGIVDGGRQPKTRNPEPRCGMPATSCVRSRPAFRR